jgi:alpha-methylacyl-CoA racemase
VDGAASLASIFHGLRAAGLWGGGRGENLLDGGAPFYATYACADGRFVAVGALEPKFFATFAQGIGLDPRFLAAQYDRRQWPAMREAIAAILLREPREHWAAHFDGSDACVTPVLSLAEAPAHAHALARQAYVEVDGLLQPAPAPRFSRSVPAAPGPAPEIGADGAAVLHDAGLNAAEIEGLRAAGVLR